MAKAMASPRDCYYIRTASNICVHEIGYCASG